MQMQAWWAIGIGAYLGFIFRIEYFRDELDQEESPPQSFALYIGIIFISLLMLVAIDWQGIMRGVTSIVAGMVTFPIVWAVSFWPARRIGIYLRRWVE